MGIIWDFDVTEMGMGSGRNGNDCRGVGVGMPRTFRGRFDLDPKNTRITPSDAHNNVTALIDGRLLC